VTQPRVLPSSAPGEALVEAEFAGLAPYCLWTKDGVLIEDDGHYYSAHTSRLAIRNFDVTDRGNYQVIASNNFGVLTSAVVTISVSCVDKSNSNPTPPYTNWTTAALTIQEAVDAASPGAVILVSNGVYSTGGRFVNGDMTNRVVLDKAITVLSLKGPFQTIIEGAWDPILTNGPSSVRCVWMGEGALLGGFTIRNGSTPLDGGGVWSSSLGLNETLVGCLITNCWAAGAGGGAYRGRLRECTIAGNAASRRGGGAALAMIDRSLIQGNSAVKDNGSSGGGIYGGIARQCKIMGNTTSGYGGGAAGEGTLLTGCAVALNTARNFGGAHNSLVYHCTVVSNTATAGAIGGVSFCVVWNSILYYNTGILDPIYGTTHANVAGSGTYRSICTFPFQFMNSITNEPQLLDALHIAVTSPCRSGGTNLGTIGFTDIDGDSWLGPPTIGCDEVVESGLVGPISVNLSGWPKVAVGGTFPLQASIEGRAAQFRLDFGDGTVVSNSVFGVTHVWTNAGDYTITGTAFNNDHPLGVSSTLSVQVIPVVSPHIDSRTKSGDIFLIGFLAQPGLIYQLHFTTNLAPPVVWQLLQSLNSTGGFMTVTHTNQTSFQSFYRLKIQ
jgi:hypothetical protein